MTVKVRITGCSQCGVVAAMEFTGMSIIVTTITEQLRQELLREGHPQYAIVTVDFEREGTLAEPLDLVRQHLREAAIPVLKHSQQPRCDGVRRATF